mmetsp:Transcript_13347/g.30299  ORF Transcript_13347/g.30299 Transcript_13347/m.30299 type:complete len:230 (+) Transcript_13347:65-754(+)
MRCSVDASAKLRRPLLRSRGPRATRLSSLAFASAARGVRGTRAMRRSGGRRLEVQVLERGAICATRSMASLQTPSSKQNSRLPRRGHSGEGVVHTATLLLDRQRGAVQRISMCLDLVHLVPQPCQDSLKVRDRRTALAGTRGVPAAPPCWRSAANRNNAVTAWRRTPNTQWRWCPGRCVAPELRRGRPRTCSRNNPGCGSCRNRDRLAAQLAVNWLRGRKLLQRVLGFT